MLVADAEPTLYLRLEDPGRRGSDDRQDCNDDQPAHPANVALAGRSGKKRGGRAAVHTGPSALRRGYPAGTRPPRWHPHRMQSLPGFRVAIWIPKFTMI